MGALRQFKLPDVGEGLTEGEILFLDATRQVGTHDADDERVKVVDELARRLLVSLAHAFQAASQIERQDVVIRHGRIEARTCTSGKTRLRLTGYRRGHDGTRP